MRTIGCDLHAAQQTIVILDRDTGEIVERTLPHDGTGAAVRHRDPAPRSRADHPIKRRTSPLLARVPAMWVTVKTPWQLLRGMIQGGAEAPGVGPRRSGGVVWELRLGAVGARASTARNEPAADQMRLLTLYADQVQSSTACLRR